MSQQLTTRTTSLAALAGVGFAVGSTAANLVIGKFPDTDTPLPSLLVFYRDHHARVAAGGMVQAWSAILLAVFAGVVYLRARDRRPLAGAVATIGAAVAVAGTLDDATAYWRLGHLGNDHAVLPAALQAWHVLGSEGTLISGGGTAIFLLAVAVAGVLPRWLGWPAFVVGALQLTPVGFIASLLFLLWTAAAGVYLAVRPAERRPALSPALASR